MRFTVDEKADGRLLRNFLRECGVSATLLAKLKRRENGILQNGVSVTVRAILHTGDQIDLAIEDREESPHVAPRDLPVDILLKTADFTVANKPCNMPTHPSHGHHEDTLANALAFRLSTENAPFRPRFINRLDRNTTGVVLVANHALAAISLSRAMVEGRIKKSYLALVHGRVECAMHLETGIRRRGESIITREVCACDEGELAVVIDEVGAFAHALDCPFRCSAALVGLDRKKNRHGADNPEGHDHDHNRRYAHGGTVFDHRIDVHREEGEKSGGCRRHTDDDRGARVDECLFHRLFSFHPFIEA